MRMLFTDLLNINVIIMHKYHQSAMYLTRLVWHQLNNFIIASEAGANANDVIWKWMSS